MNIDMIRRRSSLYRGIREYFDSKGYLEVETPTLSEHLIPEAHIECFASRFESEFYTSRDYYLIPSPEVHMKQLLAQGSGSIYQISRCFRNNEQIGPYHNPEFSMLEWYTTDSDELQNITECEHLFEAILPDDVPSDLRPPFRRMSMREACLTYAAVDLDRVQSLKELQRAMEGCGLRVDRSTQADWADEFNRLFLSLVEPELPADRPLVLTDYPARIRTLAKNDESGLYAKRWELYIRGIEIANCYAEETDPDRIEEYFETEYARLCSSRALSGATIPDTDPSYSDHFRGVYPECSGVALGLDRLLMVITATESIQGVILFPLSDTISPC